MYGCLVSWASRKQTSVALSSTEAEYVVLSVGVTEAILLRKVLQDLHRTMNNLTDILDDNQACIGVAEEEKPTKLCMYDAISSEPSFREALSSCPTIQQIYK